jgi:F0F1-type ATP synthase epsilon subunit
MANSPGIIVIIRSKEKVLFSGQAQAISSVNDKGPFDILGHHENFISLIKDRIVVRISPTEQQEIKIENGIARAYNDKIFIYVNFTS